VRVVYEEAVAAARGLLEEGGWRPEEDGKGA